MILSTFLILGVVSTHYRGRYKKCDHSEEENENKKVKSDLHHKQKLNKKVMNYHENSNNYPIQRPVLKLMSPKTSTPMTSEEGPSREVATPSPSPATVPDLPDSTVKIMLDMERRLRRDLGLKPRDETSNEEAGNEVLKLEPGRCFDPAHQQLKTIQQGQAAQPQPQIHNWQVAPVVREAFPPMEMLWPPPPSVQVVLGNNEAHRRDAEAHIAHHRDVEGAASGDSFGDSSTSSSMLEEEMELRMREAILNLKKDKKGKRNRAKAVKRCTGAARPGRGGGHGGCGAGKVSGF